MGKSLSWRRVAGQYSPRRFQVGKTETVDWQNARPSCEDARQRSDRHRDGSCGRRRITDRDDLFHHVGGEREEGIKEAVDLVWLGRSVAGAGAAVHKIKSASARVWLFRARARQ